MNHFLKLWLSQINVFPMTFLSIWIICTKTQILLIDECRKYFTAIFDDKCQFLLNLSGLDVSINFRVILIFVCNFVYCTIMILLVQFNIYLLLSLSKMMRCTSYYTSIKFDLKWSPNILKYSVYRIFHIFRLEFVECKKFYKMMNEIIFEVKK